MKKVILTAVAVLALGSFALKANPLHTKVVEKCGIDCIGLALRIDDVADLTFEEFEAVVISCEAFNLIGCR